MNNFSSTNNTYSNANLASLLKKYKAEKGSTHTNTRIGDKELNIFGGIYNIEYTKEFWDTYYKHVILNNNEEYLTEKQLINDGPLIVDIDLRYDANVRERLHDKSNIVDLLQLYANKLIAIYNFSNEAKIDVFILEKPTINIFKDKVKDGIHMIFTIKMTKAEQVVLRTKILEEIDNMWDNLPLTNSYDDIFDEGVTKGFVNWQLFGSRKPNHDAYKLSYYYSLVYNKEELNWDLNEINIDNINIRDLLPKMSARYTDHNKYELNNSEYLLKSIEEENKKLNNKEKTGKSVINNQNIDYYNIDFNKITNNEELDKYINEYILNDSIDNYELKETFLFTMILPMCYYDEGSYNKWIRVGWALRNYDEKSCNCLSNSDKKSFLIWLKFSSKSKTFDFNSIAELYEKWLLFDNNNPDGLTKRSILFWAKSDNYEEYIKVRNETISYYVDKTLDAIIAKDKVGEFDLANVLYQLCKDQFVCVNIKKDIWYEYKNNRWHEIDSATTLRLIISKRMHDIYLKKAQNYVIIISQNDSNEDEEKQNRLKATKLGDICMILKTTSWKNNIMKEAKDLFYDSKFIQKLDSNPYLLAFNNYVVDFKNKTYRKGRPDDYISKTTNNDYIPHDKLIGHIPNNKEILYEDLIKEINKFINELFPNKELKQYMWEHLASLLLGTTDNQTFNIYTGSGCNGKSKLVELMSKCLGDYKAMVPISLITQSRNTIGSTSSEVAQLIGIRYAVMQEPSKGDKINEGILKEITGGDPVQARALYQEPVTFIPQFKLAVCTNTLFDIKSNDDGTWRRIRVCDFEGKFLDNPYEDEIKFPKENFPYQYQIDRKIDEKFVLWAPVLMSMLVEIAYVKQGHVKDVKAVTSVSDKYREGQDYLTEFIKDKIIRKRDGKIKEVEILEEFRNWYIMHYGKNNLPKGKEITDYMDKLYGKRKKGKWMNVEICYNDDDDYDDYES
tara:strand:+ start:6270 stop:9134 length:2865 start_codon:yes stop_codon:yes gene_type:complete